MIDTKHKFDKFLNYVKLFKKEIKEINDLKIDYLQKLFMRIAEYFNTIIQDIVLNDITYHDRITSLMNDCVMLVIKNQIVNSDIDNFIVKY